MRGRKRKTRLMTDRQSPPSQGPVVKEKVLPEEPSNDMPLTLQSTTTFQPVNVVEDSDTEEAEGTGICIRKRRKQASEKW